ncbi:alpha/beta hydrolase [Sorangium cellulosum]|uniref:Alpha/beta hydrolase n=1 Tax=Sorangium cellulosum TaxID=56 RepID=A0A2L0F795_SORCE|nr:alpha/beta fold hydrolase [Sorangium cellulosum]AUX47464.1 alpha/beta hydrolase [Sorangium cellulosum]
MTNVYAVVSRPGPTERAMLEELAAGSPPFVVRRRAALSATLRCLEGGSGSPVVLLHGRGNAATTWFPLLPELARRHRVVALDLPGFGHASSPPFEGGGFEEGLRFFVEPVEELLLEMDLGGAALVGHSLGALVAAEIALRRRARPRKLALIAAMGVGPVMTASSRAYFRASPERLVRVLGAGLFRRVHPPRPTPLGERLAALHNELYAVPDGRVAPVAAFNALFPAFGPVPHRLSRLGEIDIETLVLWGERDDVFPAPIGIAAAAAIPRSTLRLLPLGHAPHLEDPALVLPELTAFLAP